MNEQTTGTETRLWDAQDVAAYLKCSTSYVYKAAEAGLLPCLRVGRMLRFDPAQILLFARGEWKPSSMSLVPYRGG